MTDYDIKKAIGGSKQATVSELRTELGKIYGLSRLQKKKKQFQTKSL